MKLYSGRDVLIRLCELQIESCCREVKVVAGHKHVSFKTMALSDEVAAKSRSSPFFDISSMTQFVEYASSAFGGGE